jgi:MerR family copper efflux transcriptional regulator
MKENDAYGIGELAKAAGVGVETVRFYERERLLERPQRTSGNYRRYDAAALGRLRFIRNAKELGFTLDEIRRLLRMSRDAHTDAGDFHELASEKIAWIDGRIAQLRNMRRTLSRAVEACPGHGADKSRCPVLGLLTGERRTHPSACRCEACAAHGCGEAAGNTFTLGR